jgi:hypothetical protein
MNRKDGEARVYIRKVPALLGLLLMSWASAAASDLRVVPDSIRIGPFFSGASVRVSGKIPEGSRAIVEVIGKRIEEQLLRKGRRWDIWMNVGEIDIEDAPYVYYALSTDPEEFSGPGATREFGYAALKKRAYFKGDVRGIGQDEVFRRFIELKEEENLYRLQPGALRVSEPSGGLETVEGSFRIPSRIPPGEYRVRLSIVDPGLSLPSESASLAVRMDGLPAFLSSLSLKHGSLYGLFAVAIAVLFGFLVGVAFKRGRAH